MNLTTTAKMVRNPVFGFFLLVVFLLVTLPVEAYLNRSYSSLEEARSFDGDFMDILAQGKLRILLTRNNTNVAYLPRHGSPLADQQRIAEEFALSHGLIPELVLVDNFSKLIPALEQGKGDIVISNLTINPDRLKKMAFSVPLDHVVEQVLVDADDKAVNRVRDLDGKSVLVNRDSTFWHALTWLKKNRYPDIEIVEVPDGMQTEEILDQVAEGKVDATILDSNLVEIYLGYRDDLRRRR